MSNRANGLCNVFEDEIDSESDWDGITRRLDTIVLIGGTGGTAARCLCHCRSSWGYCGVRPGAAVAAVPVAAVLLQLHDLVAAALAGVELPRRAAAARYQLPAFERHDHRLALAPVALECLGVRRAAALTDLKVCSAMCASPWVDDVVCCKVIIERRIGGSKGGTGAVQRGAARLYNPVLVAALCGRPPAHALTLHLLVGGRHQTPR